MKLGSIGQHRLPGWAELPKELGLHVLVPSLAALACHQAGLSRNWKVLSAAVALAASFAVEGVVIPPSGPRGYTIVPTPGDGHCLFHSIARMTTQNLDSSELLVRLANAMQAMLDDVRRITPDEIREAKEALPQNRRAQLVADVIHKSESRGPLNEARTHLNLEQQVLLMFEWEPLLAFACAKRIVANGDPALTEEADQLLDEHAFLCFVRVHVIGFKFRSSGQAPSGVRRQLGRSVVWNQVQESQDDAIRLTAEMYIQALEDAAGDRGRLWGDDPEIKLLSQILKANIIVYQSHGRGVRERCRKTVPNPVETILVHYTGNHYSGIRFDCGIPRQDEVIT